MAEKSALRVADFTGQSGVIFDFGNMFRKVATPPLRLGSGARALCFRPRRETAIGILLATLLPTIRNLLLAKDLMERNHLPRQIASTAQLSFPRRNRFVAKKKRNICREKKRDGWSTADAVSELQGDERANSLQNKSAGPKMEACLQANLEPPPPPATI